MALNCHQAQIMLAILEIKASSASLNMMISIHSLIQHKRHKVAFQLGVGAQWMMVTEDTAPHSLELTNIQQHLLLLRQSLKGLIATLWIEPTWQPREMYVD